jgi:hypothetical protein
MDKFLKNNIENINQLNKFIDNHYDDIQQILMFLVYVVTII